MSAAVEDDEGMGHEALYYAERYARPEARRSHERAWREGTKRVVRGKTGDRSYQSTWTMEEYVDPAAPGPVRHEQVAGRPFRSHPVSGWVWDYDEELDDVRWFAPGEHGDPIDHDLLTEDERFAAATTDSWSYWMWDPEEPADEYEKLAEQVGEYQDDDDRPLWQQELDGEIAPSPRPPRYRWTAPSRYEQPGQVLRLRPVPEDTPLCGNPEGCTEPVKAKERCGACHEYRRTHRGQERPERLIMRSLRRRHPL